MRKMNSKPHFFYLLLITVLISGFSIALDNNPTGINDENVEIYSVSDRIDKFDVVSNGSIGGGSQIIIQAKGHSSIPSKNKILIGEYPCIVDEKGISENIISCWTTPMEIKNSELNVVLQVENKMQSVCKSRSGKCKYTYHRNETPFLRWIIPSVAAPNTKVRWDAYWRIDSYKYINEMKIGDQNCNRFQLSEIGNQETLINLSDDTKLERRGTQIVECVTSSEQTAGIYDVHAQNTKGNFHKYPSSRQTTADGQTQYDFIVTANIEEITPSIGSEHGNKIKIKGKGFGNNKEKVSVKVGSENCPILSIENSNIVCELAPGVQPTENIGQFIHGQGVQFTLYHLPASPDGVTPSYGPSNISFASELKQKIQDNTINTDRIQEDGIIGAWELEDFPTYTGFHMRGYFKAPRTGTYKFWAAVDDKAQVYLNTNEMTPSISDGDLILDITDYSHIRNYHEPNEDQVQIQETGQVLQEGKLYWIEVFAVNMTGSGHFTLSVECAPPSDNSYWINSLSETQYFRIVPNKDTEQWKFRVYNKDKYNVYMQYIKDQKTITKGFVDRTDEGIVWNLYDQNQFIRKISEKFGYNPKIIEWNDLDDQGRICTGCTPAGFEIKFEFQDFRNYGDIETSNLQCFNCSINRVQRQSPPLSGTFTLQVTWKDGSEVKNELVSVWKVGKGWSTNIYFDTVSQGIKTGLILLDQRFIDIDISSKYKPVDGQMFIFKFSIPDQDFKGDIVDFVVDVSNIEGGKGPHSVEQGELISSNNHPFHEPVPFDMSFVVADKPSVQVTVNEVLSQCSGDCTYQTSVDKTPELTTFSEVSKTLNLGITLPSGLVLAVSDLEILFGGYDCDSSAGGSDIAAFTCTVAGIEAGDHLPIIFAEGVGFVKPNGSLVAVIQGLTVSSLNPTSSSVNGGQEVTISGSGFPQNKNIENVVVKFGTVVANVKSSSDTQIIVDIPSSQTGIGAVNVQVEYNGKVSTSSSFTYVNTGIPTITSVEIDSVTTNFGSKVEVNPFKKQAITITGTNFEDGKTSVWLLDKVTDEQIYEIEVNNVVPLEIQATLNGGKVREYHLIVSHQDNGNSEQKFEFDYIIKINNIDLFQGPQQGGPKITLTGEHFGAGLEDNQVFFEQGSDIKVQASIESSSETSIVARIPRMPADGDILLPFTITVFGKVIEQAICLDGTNNCQLTYQEGILVPELVISNPRKVQNGVDYLFLGVNLPLAGSPDTAELIVQGFDSPYPLNFDAEDRFGVFVFPEEIPAGQYFAQVKLESYGVIGEFTLVVELVIGDVQPINIGLGGGELVISGSGFSERGVVFIDSKQCMVKSVSGTQLTCVVTGNSGGQKKLTIKEPYVGEVSCIDCIRYYGFVGFFAAATVPTSTNAIQYIPVGSTPFIFQATLGKDFSEPKNVYFQSIYNGNVRLEADNIVVNEKEITATFNQVMAGTFEVQIEVVGKGFALINDACQNSGECVGPVKYITFELEALSFVSGQQTGLAGRSELVLSGKGFNTVDVFMNEISVCGEPCVLKEGGVSYNQIQCELPMVNTVYAFDYDYEVMQQNLDKRSSQKVLLDRYLQKIDTKTAKYIKKVTTNITGTKNVINEIVEKSFIFNENDITNEFIIEFEAQENSKVFLERIVLDPGKEYNMEKYYGKVKLQAKNAVGDAWVDLDTFTTGHLSEYQELTLKVEDTSENAEQDRKTFVKSKIFKYFRVVEAQELGEKALCKLFIKKIVGIPFYEQEVSGDVDFNCGVVARVNDQFVGISGDATVTYKGGVFTPRVTEISPQFSTLSGSEIIAIKGNNFGTNILNVKVFIDGQECTIDSVDNNNIVFTTPGSIVPVVGAKNIEVTVSDVPVLFKKGIIFFSGAMRWSNEDAWEGNPFPRDQGDVVVDKGKTLVVDMNTPLLNSLLVKGTLLFDHSLNIANIEVKAQSIIAEEGRIIAGTETQPYTNKLTFTLYGKYQQQQQIFGGNKGIVCQNCQVDLHAGKGGPHFAFLKQTVVPGESTLKVSSEVYWEVGDYIGIATTDFKGEHSEKVQIVTIFVGSNETTITFSPQLKYKHLAEEEIFGSKTLKNYAEIVLLSSNIVIRGDPEDSEIDQYGAYLSIQGKQEDGTVARIDGVEFFNTGQQGKNGRSSCEFSRLGDSPNSYVRNIKVHSAFARVVAVQATNYLRILNNVGFNVPGHNIFLEDSIETNNIIQGNVMISPRSAYGLLSTDITVSGILISNPSNTVRKNYVAGSQFYGIQYDIKSKPDSRTELCPRGMKILELQDNISHSNERYGLRFDSLRPKTYPCQSTTNTTAIDIYEDNPSLQSTFRNHLSYKNGESGILAEYMGNSIFEDCIIADNFKTGFQSHLHNRTAEPVVLRNSVIVGKSGINGLDDIFEQASAIILPRTDGFFTDNVEIYNMPAGSTIIESSSQNSFKEVWTQGSYQNNINSISIMNSDSATKLKWVGPRGNLLFDQDGSFTGKNVPTWITPYYVHHDKAIADGVCERDQVLFDDSILCSVPLRAVKFGNLIPQSWFKHKTLHVFNVNDETKIYDRASSDQNNFGKIPFIDINNDYWDFYFGYVAVLPVDYVYNIHWSTGIDWDHMLVYPSYLTEEGDKNTILRFPYDKQREIFDIYRMVSLELVKVYTQKSDLGKFIDSVTGKPYDGADKCSNGDWIQDDDNKFFYLCLSGKGREDIKYQQIAMNGIFCRDSCDEGINCDREKQFRQFIPDTDEDKENTYTDQALGAMAMVKAPGSQDWEYRVPQEGDDVRIPCEFMMMFNVDSFRFNNLIIDGVLRIDPNRPKSTIYATNIWIRGGKLAAGTKDAAFDKEFEIILEGGKSGESIMIDDEANPQKVNKALAITGRLELFGIFPSTTQTKLIETLNSGDTQIRVQNDIFDWNVGDLLVLGANKRDGSGFETVEILSKDDDTRTIQLVNPVQNWHYGHHYVTAGTSDFSETIIHTAYGGNLDMRASVGHITRKIKIKGNEEDTQWGGHILITHYKPDLDGEINILGSAHLQGVELENMGQRGTDNAGIHIFNTTQTVEYHSQTIIQGSSIHDSKGICVNALQADWVTIDNNVFYNGRRFHIQALESKRWVITNNLMIGVRERNAEDFTELVIWDPVAFIYMYSPYSVSDWHSVQGNTGQGSEGIGFAFPGIDCQEKTFYKFINNMVGHCKYAGILFNFKENMCYYAGSQAVYNTRKGIIINSQNAEEGYFIEKFRIAECDINISLRSGSSSSMVNNNFVKKMWVSAIARPTCTDCYSQERLDNQESSCSNGVGIQLHVTTEEGESFPWFKSPLSFDKIGSAPSAFSSCMMEDILLHNYKDTYSEANLSLCKQNIGFKNHPSAASATASHYLTNVSCQGCDKEALVYIMEPSVKWRGWYGGCGHIDCTGLRNVLIQDLSGNLLGHVGSIISNNEDITENSAYFQPKCTFFEKWNAYDCETEEFGVLEWDAVSSDKEELKPAPVQVSNIHFENTINMWREQQFRGRDPLNRRKNRYISIVSMNQINEINYSGSQCTEIVHKLAQRSSSGEIDRFIVVKYQYNSPLALEIQVNDVVVDHWPLNDQKDLMVHSKGICGANNYYYQSNEIHFVITNEVSCQVKVVQKNVLNIYVNMNLSPEEVQQVPERVVQFQGVLASFLGIDPTQVSVVAVNPTRRRMISNENQYQQQQQQSELQFIVKGDEPGYPEQGYRGDKSYLRLRDSAKLIGEGLRSRKLSFGFEAELENYVVNVVKKAATENEESSFMNEEDFKNDIYVGGLESKLQKHNYSRSVYTILQGVLFGVLGTGFLVLLVYIFWKKHQKVNGIRSIKQEEMGDYDDDDQGNDQQEQEEIIQNQIEINQNDSLNALENIQ